MRSMGKVFEVAAITSLALGVAAGCGGEESTKQEAHVVGFARGTDATVVEDRWVSYTDERTLPNSQIRNPTIRDEFSGCREVANGYFDFGFDDAECWGDLWCSSDEDTHCEAQHVKVYDFEALEEVPVKTCYAPLQKTDFKADPVSDEECLATVQPNQRVIEVSRFVLWVETDNPKYNPEKNDEPAKIISALDVSAAEWQVADRSVPVSVTISGGRIADVNLGQ